jgi:hypothetical protein
MMNLTMDQLVELQVVLRRNLEERREASLRSSETVETSLEAARHMAERAYMSDILMTALVKSGEVPECRSRPIQVDAMLLNIGSIVMQQWLAEQAMEWMKDRAEMAAEDARDA